VGADGADEVVGAVAQPTADLVAPPGAADALQHAVGVEQQVPHHHARQWMPVSRCRAA
jgi:hypothetical protein